MVVFSPSAGQYRRICSGTLISPTVFLTASHCTDAAEQVFGTDRVYVSFDPVFSQEATRLPGTAFTNPAFTNFQGKGGMSDPHDIGVIVLDDPVTGITPAQLPTAGLLDGLNVRGGLRDETFTAVGYGRVRETRTGGPANILANNDRRYGLQGFLSLTPAWLTLSMNQATGNAGTARSFLSAFVALP